MSSAPPALPDSDSEGSYSASHSPRTAHTGRSWLLDATHTPPHPHLCEVCQPLCFVIDAVGQQDDAAFHLLLRPAVHTDAAVLDVRELTAWHLVDVALAQWEDAILTQSVALLALGARGNQQVLGEEEAVARTGAQLGAPGRGRLAVLQTHLVEGP